MKFKILNIFLALMILKSNSAICQDSSITKPISQQIGIDQKIVEDPKDTTAQKIQADSIKTIPKTKKVVNQFVVSSKYPTINPFNLLPYPTAYGKFTGAFLYADKIFNSTKLSIGVTQNLRKSKNKDWIFFLLSSLLFFLAILNVIFRKYFNDLFLVFFKTSMRQNQLNEQILQAELPSLLLNIFFMASSGILLYFIFLYPQSKHFANTWVEIFYCIAIPTSIYLFKFIFIRIISWLFSKGEAGKIYIFNVFLVNKVIGLFFVALTIFLAYAEPASTKIIITLATIGLIFFVLMRMNKCFFATNQVIKISFTHFLLFVVSFELIPVLIVCKVLLRVIH
jgi:hypothetical protein